MQDNFIEFSNFLDQTANASFCMTCAALTSWEVPRHAAREVSALVPELRQSSDAVVHLVSPPGILRLPGKSKQLMLTRCDQNLGLAVQNALGERV